MNHVHTLDGLAVPLSAWRALKQLADDTGMSVNQLVNNAVKLYLDVEGYGEPANKREG